MKTPEEVKSGIDAIIKARAALGAAIADLFGGMPSDSSVLDHVQSNSDEKLVVYLQAQMDDLARLETIKQKLSPEDLEFIKNNL